MQHHIYKTRRVRTHLPGLVEPFENSVHSAISNLALPCSHAPSNLFNREVLVVEHIQNGPAYVFVKHLFEGGRAHDRNVWGFPVYCAKKHSAVSDEATLRGAGRHLFFLSSFSLTTVARSLASPYRA